MNIIHQPEHGVPIPTSELHEHGIPVRYWGVDYASLEKGEWNLGALICHEGFDDKREHADAQADFIAWINGVFLPQIAAFTDDQFWSACGIESVHVIIDGTRCGAVGLTNQFDQEWTMKLGCWERKPNRLLAAAKPIQAAIEENGLHDSGPTGESWPSEALRKAIDEFDAAIAAEEEK